MRWRWSATLLLSSALALAVGLAFVSAGTGFSGSAGPIRRYDGCTARPDFLLAPGGTFVAHAARPALIVTLLELLRTGGHRSVGEPQ